MEGFIETIAERLAAGETVKISSFGHVHGARQGAAHGPEPEDGRAGAGRRHVVAPGRTGLAGDPRAAATSSDAGAEGSSWSRRGRRSSDGIPLCPEHRIASSTSSAARTPSDAPEPGPWPGSRVLSWTQGAGRAPQAGPSSASSRRRIAPLLICRPRSRHRRPKAARTTDTRPLRPRSRTYRGRRQCELDHRELRRCCSARNSDPPTIEWSQ